MASFARSVVPVAAASPACRVARPVPKRMTAIRATSNNEVVKSEAPIEPAVFYGGNSYTESEVMPRFCYTAQQPPT